MEQQTINAPKKNNTNLKWLIGGLGVAGVGVLTYFGFRYFKDRNSESKGDDADKANAEAAAADAARSSAKPKTPKTPAEQGRKTTMAKPPSGSGRDTTTSAPEASAWVTLKKGSKGEKVKALQQALINTYGKTILPKYGANGTFTTEVSAALKKAGLPATIDESTYNVLVGATAPDPSATAKGFYNAIAARDFGKTLSLLKTMRNTEDYKSIGKLFSDYRIGAVRQTLVNAALSAFGESKQKQAIRMEFLRMGLKYDGNKWALSGLPSAIVMTIRATSVQGEGQNYNVLRMVLGRAISVDNNYIFFAHGSHQFHVPRRDVQYIHYKTTHKNK